MATPTSRSPITLCGSISRHPARLGAAMHRAGYEVLGLEYVYVPFGVTDLEGAMRGVRALGVRGVGVSMPFKIDVMRYLDAVDPLARRIGAVNTVVNDDGVLTGYNFDAYGAVTALAEALPVAGRRVMVLGAGGAARAVGFALREAGAVIHVANRTRAKALELADALDATGGGIDDAARLDGYDAVVNCTSVGMADQRGDCPIPEEAIPAGIVVMDIVYKPVRTRLLEVAARRGARVVHGGRMLLHQACKQFEAYTGRPAPLRAMESALDANLDRG